MFFMDMSHGSQICFQTPACEIFIHSYAIYMQKSIYMVGDFLASTNLFYPENMIYTFKSSQVLSLLKSRREISMVITIHQLSQEL